MFKERAETWVVLARSWVQIRSGDLREGAKLRIISSSASAKRRDRDASPDAGMLFMRRLIWLKQAAC